MRGHTKGRLSSKAIHPAPLVLSDRATQVSRPQFSTALYGRLNNGWAMLGQRTECGRLHLGLIAPGVGVTKNSPFVNCDVSFGYN